MSTAYTSPHAEHTIMTPKRQFKTEFFHKTRYMSQEHWSHKHECTTPAFHPLLEKVAPARTLG